MKIALAQLNPVVGDISGNVARLADTLSRCPADTDLIIFTELFLVGYPPRDLLERPAFIRKSQQALEEVARLSAQHPQTGILVGGPRSTDRQRGKGLANSALFCFFKGSSWPARTSPSCLPTTSLQTRHFDPARQVRVILSREKQGISICEDAWCGLESWCRRLYDWDPIEVLAQKGATLLINLSASPFQVGKESPALPAHAGPRQESRDAVYLRQPGGRQRRTYF